MNKEPNFAFAMDIKQILTDEQNRCLNCPINGIDGANGLRLVMDAKYGRKDEEEVIEAAHDHAEFVNRRCRIGPTAVRQAGCFPSVRLHCNIDRA